MKQKNAHYRYLHHLLIRKRTNFYMRNSSALYSNQKSIVKSSKTTSCVFCGSKNSPNRCLLISETSTRKKLIKQKWLCFVCLKEGHLANTCSEKYSCQKCHGRHNIAICTFSKPGPNPFNSNSQLSSSNLSDKKITFYYRL